jgi:ClpP class serine protease
MAGVNLMELYALDKIFAASFLELMENASTEDRAAAFSAFANEPLPSIINRVENTNEATVRITGMLTPAGPSPLARFFGFGGTGYSEIIAAAKELEDDLAINKVTFAIDTPGGTVAAMDLARQAIESLASKKTVIVENHGRILSAGYYLATAKGVTAITATTPLVQTGSIGVIIAGLDFTDAMAREGVKTIKIISKNAPNKQADPTTVQGLKVHQDNIDAIERVFLQKVAEGRNTTVENVIENFGKGGTLIASDPDIDQPDALKAGMIDSLITQVAENVQEEFINEGVNSLETETTADGGQKMEAVMDLNQLKAEHPAIFAEAVAVGVTQERERVDAHITMGKAAGDMELAVSCIETGVEHSASSNAKYMASQMNKNAVADRGSESEGDLETEGAGANAGTDDVEDELANATAELLGVEING